MKKLLSLLLVMVMILGMATVASAKAAPSGNGVKINGMVSGLGQHVGSDIYESTELRPNTSFDLPLTADMFSWDNYTPGSDEAVTLTQLRAGKFTIKFSVKKGSKFIKEVAIENGTYNNSNLSAANGTSTAAVKIRFVDQFASLKEEAIDIIVYPVMNGSRKADYQFQLTGTMENPIKEVMDGDDFVDISDSSIIEAVERVKDFEVEIGEGVTVVANLTRNRKYWAIASTDTSSADDAVFDKYPSITDIYTISAINLDSVAQYVLFSDLTGDQYVYDKNYKLLGMGTDEIPFATKYYISDEKINASTGRGSVEDSEEFDEPGDDEEEDDWLEDLPTDTPIPSYDDNINDNPSTGR